MFDAMNTGHAAWDLANPVFEPSDSCGSAIQTDFCPSFSCAAG
jgi:hypothetical protein